jgi:hypothetical protein
MDAWWVWSSSAAAEAGHVEARPRPAKLLEVLTREVRLLILEEDDRGTRPERRRRRAARTLPSAEASAAGIAFVVEGERVVASTTRRTSLP